ncbi:ABC-F family ATP-binding cassette domain-containing protein [Candidatus Uhrbacteria bacterium]|nr:ABC-F family ATP-binding cassette domain-containing protein [Candidatus Uhrbacteria bacterium]
MAQENVVLRFNEVTYEYSETKRILDDASFSVRNNSKIALMGQNGAGKTTLFSLILSELKPKSGQISKTPPSATVGIAKQVIPPDQMDMTVRDWFASTFHDVPYNLDKRIADVLNAVNLATDLAKKVREHSGGQHARLLLAYSLIQNPDILLLDEPTNNLDQEGINHLTGFLMMYEKTVIVISHDADFLNAFTDGVLYLDVHTHTVEQHVGTYYDVVQDIAERIERERMANARAETEIRKKKAQAEVFAHKGGKLRLVAKRMREYAEDMEEGMVEVRREDKTIRSFSIPAQEFGYDFNGRVLEITNIGSIKNGEPQNTPVDIVLRKDTHLLLTGPNGIGKSTFLESITSGNASGVNIGTGVRVGYYRQDFSMLNFQETAYDSLWGVMPEKDEHLLRSTAAGFLLDGKSLSQKIVYLSEGQKGLLAFARLVLEKPGLLILDEPTNHINFRHLPLIAKALDAYEGALILVSHIPDFVSQVRIDTTIDLSALEKTLVTQRG